MQSQIHCSDTQDVSFSWIDVPIPVHRERLVMFGVWIIEYLRVTHPQGKSWGRWCVFVCVQLCLFFFQLLCVCVCKRERESEIDAETHKGWAQVGDAFSCVKYSLLHPLFSHLRRVALVLKAHEPKATSWPTSSRRQPGHLQWERRNVTQVGHSQGPVNSPKERRREM